MISRSIQWGLSLLALLGLHASAFGYANITGASGFPAKWYGNTIPMQIKVDNSTSLTDGNTRATSIKAAMIDSVRGWNHNLGTVQFVPQIASTGAGGDQNGVNEISFASSVYGQAWDADAIAVTVYYLSGDKFTEGDIIFNTAYSWDSYRGALHTNNVYDIQRVALHELGHVLGLDHPDDHGQTVMAIMNSAISDVDALQADDIAGAQSIYGAPGIRPANDNFADAIAIGASNGSTEVTGTNVAATKEAAEPNHAGDPGGHSVWWKWTAIGSGTVMVDTGASNFDTTLGVYTGSSVSSLNTVAANDNVSVTNVSSQLTFNASSGVVYYFAVDGAAGDTGTIGLTLQMELPPTISAQPASQDVNEGDAATFTVVASGSNLVTYQWRKNSVAIAGANAATYSIPVTVLADSGNYDVVVTSGFASTTSNAAVLTVHQTAPLVTLASPRRQVLLPGGNLSLSVTASPTNGGSGPLSYQWTHNGRPIPGANSSSLTVSGLSLADGGWYLALVSDAVGTRRSAAMFVIVSVGTTRVLAWGDQGVNQYTPNAALNDLVAVSVGSSHALGLKRDGTVVAWGSMYGWSIDPPADLTEIVAISASETRSLALKSDGTVVGWNGRVNGLNMPPDLTNVVAISSGPSIAAALKADGTVFVWNPDTYGDPQAANNLVAVVAVAAGDQQVLALKSDGTAAWVGAVPDQQAVPSGLSDVVAISCGRGFSMAAKSDNSVVAWGTGTNLYVGAGQGPTRIASISAGYDYALALYVDGTNRSWRNPELGTSVIPPALSRLQALSAGTFYSVALQDTTGDTLPVFLTQPQPQSRAETQTATFSATVSGAIPLTYQWRKDGVDIVGANSPTLTVSNLTLAAAGTYDIVVSNYLGSVTSTPAGLTVRPLPKVTTVTPRTQTLQAGQSVTLSVSATGTGALSYQWMHNGVAIAGATAGTLTLNNISSADAGFYYVTVTDDVGTTGSPPFSIVVGGAPVHLRVVAWGSSTATNIPADLGDVTAISTGLSYTLALKADGTVAAWGANNNGQLNVPAGLGNVIAIAAGESASFALKSDGTVVSWGAAYAATNMPSGPSNIVAINSSFTHTLALTAAGTVIAWGDNLYGECSVPANLAGVAAVVAGNGYSMALKGDGTVVAWGRNYGALGPTTVPANLSDIVGISARSTSVLAVRADGTVVAWGYDTGGETLVPAGLDTVTQVAMAENSALALKADHTVVGWGANDQGQTILPNALKNVFAVSAGDGFSVALVELPADNTPLIVAQPVSKYAGIGQTETFFITAVGAGNVTYQWFKDGVPIFNAVGSSLKLTNVQLSDRGSYSVVVSNTAGSVVSTDAELGVVALSGGDFDRDGQPDLFLQDIRTGDRRIWLMNGTVYRGVAYMASVSPDLLAVAVADFNHDGKPDLVCENRNTGERSIELMDGATVISTISLGVIPIEWSIVGAADFNSDGNPDLVWENAVTGERYLWLMNGPAFAGGVSLGIVPTTWTISGVADFDRDGQPDLLWTNTATGERSLWMMNGASHAWSATLGIFSLNYRIMGVADYNGDGWPDLVVSDVATGEQSIWLMAGATHVGTISLGALPPDWVLGRPSTVPAPLAKLDFDHDGHADLLWENTTTGEHYLWFMNGPEFVSGWYLGTVSVQWRVAASIDLTDDGRPDLIWENSITGERYVWYMDGRYFSSGTSLGTVAPDWHIVAAGDFNGDGQADLVWENSSTGERYLWLMNGTAFSSSVYLGTIGTEWHIADCADFNGDGQPDLLWENASTGERYVWLMNGTAFASAVNLGTISTDWHIAAAADFNGDGQPDIVWQNTSTGERYLWLMNGATFSSGVSLGVISPQWRIVP